MKTYWLQSRDSRMPYDMRRSRPPEPPPPRSLPAVMPPPSTSASREAIYSPVTFQDVARRSIANSPIKTAESIRQRETRSYSMSAAHMKAWPSEVFGSEVHDLGEFPATPSSSTTSNPCTPDVAFLRHLTAPSTKLNTAAVDDYSREKTPPSTAPPAVNVLLFGTHMQTSSAKVDILQVNHENSSDQTVESTILPGMTSPPTSKSDGDLLTIANKNKNVVHNVPNSHSDANLNPQQQCCASFGTTAAKHRNHANGCVML